MCGTVDTFINSAQDLGESLSDGAMQKYSRGSPMLLTPLKVHTFNLPGLNKLLYNSSLMYHTTKCFPEHRHVCTRTHTHIHIHQ